MKILIVTDAWLPQVNGVVATLRNTVRELEGVGHTVKLITADGFRNVVRWSRGVDTGLFKPAPRRASGESPVFLYVGRVAVAKNIEDFLRLDLPGTKWIVGDGPARKALQSAYPGTVFHGMRHGAELAHFYQQADVFVFPSRTDTFGLVLIEAMACGTPVAAYPVTGPADVVLDARAGILSNNLRTAAIRALRLDRAEVHQYGVGYSWTAATRQFVDNLRPTRERALAAA